MFNKMICILLLLVPYFVNAQSPVPSGAVLETLIPDNQQNIDSLRNELKKFEAHKIGKDVKIMLQPCGC